MLLLVPAILRVVLICYTLLILLVTVISLLLIITIILLIAIILIRGGGEVFCQVVPGSGPRFDASLLQRPKGEVQRGPRQKHRTGWLTGDENPTEVQLETAPRRALTHAPAL